MSELQTTLPDIRYIDTPEGLEQACRDLANQPYLAVDTEFVREKTYYPVLCLIQLASPEHCVCVDPLVLEDLSPLRDLLLDQGTTKVFHAARQDLEILQQTFGQIPAPVFDTQIAATLLGLGDQLSYANLARHFLEVHLSKGHARTDWERRPLSNEQIQYAADDVRYLVALYPLMRQKLEGLGRLDWLQDDFTALIDPELYQNNPRQQWLRVSGSQKLRGVQLAILQELADWRENQAQKKNKPRKWILPDDSLIALCMQGPERIEQLERIRGLNPGLVKNNGQVLLERIAYASSLPKESWPVLRKRKSLSHNQDAILDALMAIVRLQSANHSISHTALCSRHDLEAVIAGENQIPLLLGWRRSIAGQAVLDFLSGHTQLHVKHNELGLTTEG